ncbi:hypothetical protein HDV01_007666 [Terramyces sp. JEL0728]|nr:hypothetical protein HDV01_007666 [Terramyces sp. JEL0728]
MEHGESASGNRTRRDETRELEAEKLRQEIDEKLNKAQERRASLRDIKLDSDHFDAVKTRQLLSEREKQESNATLNEEMFTKQNRATARREDSIEYVKEHARNFNYDVELVVRERRQMDEKLEESLAHAAKHELDLKLELAEALRADRLNYAKERIASLRHEPAE